MKRISEVQQIRKEENWHIPFVSAKKVCFWEVTNAEILPAERDLDLNLFHERAVILKEIIRAGYGNAEIDTKKTGLKKPAASNNILESPFDHSIFGIGRLG